MSDSISKYTHKDENGFEVYEEGLLRRYMVGELEVKAYEGGAIRGRDSYSNKVYVSKKENARNKYDLELFCDANKNCPKEAIRDVIHDSIEAYFEEQILEERRVDEDEEDVLFTLYKDLKVSADIKARSDAAQLRKNHRKLIDFLLNKRRLPENEMRMYQYYVERVKYGKMPEVLAETAQKFDMSINSAKVLMDWYNKNFMFLHSYSQHVAEHPLKRTTLRRVGNGKEASTYRSEVLDSIAIYKLNFK